MPGLADSESPAYLGESVESLSLADALSRGESSRAKFGGCSASLEGLAGLEGLRVMAVAGASRGAAAPVAGGAMCEPGGFNSPLSAARVLAACAAARECSRRIVGTSYCCEGAAERGPNTDSSRSRTASGRLWSPGPPGADRCVAAAVRSLAASALVGSAGSLRWRAAGAEAASVLVESACSCLRDADAELHPCAWLGVAAAAFPFATYVELIILSTFLRSRRR
mmetsp:Transcript_21187/g.36380  ORF Transcript_21187/g.36380 Transcript_21187/m.36380 type:complete len:224 (-) Transcript_21187:1123-1794(-)